MKVEDYKDGSASPGRRLRVAEIPTISGCYARTRTHEAEVSNVFKMRAEEYAKTRIPLPADTTVIIHA